MFRKTNLLGLSQEIRANERLPKRPLAAALPHWLLEHRSHVFRIATSRPPQRLAVAEEGGTDVPNPVKIVHAAPVK